MYNGKQTFRLYRTMLHWLTLPKRDDEYEAFAAHVLHYTLLLLISIAIVFIFFVSSPSQLIFIPIIIGVCSGAYYLLHIGHLRAAGLSFVSGLWLVITLSSFSINGIRNASISSYAIVIIFAAILFSDRMVVVFTTMSVLAAIILAVGELLKVLPLHTTPLYLADRFFQQIALFGAAGVLLFAASRVIRASLQRVRKHEETLLERNRQLEIEITERQRTEANLRVSEEKYRLLFENIPVMAGVYAEDGEIILLNYAAARQLGGTPETFQGRNMREVFATEDAEKSIKSQARVIEDGKDVLIENKVQRADGRDFYYLRHIMPLPHTINRTTSQVLVLMTDLTESYMAEQRKRELVSAHEKNAFLTDFFSTLSHDLKTPLAVMTTSLYLLKHAETSQKRDERITRISDQIDLMDKYIQDMLIISRLEHLPTLNFKKLDLNTLVEQGVDRLRPRIEGKQLIFQFMGQANLPSIWGDQEQIQRMLTNLIENAINYTPISGQVDVKTYKQRDHVMLEVTDNGIGIEPEAVPHIFERFFRTANATKFERNGTGLGLSIVKKIVEMHTATIDLHSQPGEGTTFYVQFPVEAQ